MDASKLGVKKYICTECDESYTETIDALGHKYVDTVIKPTESESGYTLHKCKECLGNDLVKLEIKIFRIQLLTIHT